MDLRAKTVLSFDCYGTLIDWERGLLSSLEPLYARHGIALLPDQVLPSFARLESQAERPPYRSYREVLRGVLAQLAAEVGISLREGEHDLLAEGMMDWRPFDDTVAALRRLSERVSLVIISNVDHELFAGAMRSLEISFDVCVLAQDVRAYKPDPAVFSSAKARLQERGLLTGDDLGPWLHCAQSLFHDVSVAGAMGIDTVHVTRRLQSLGAAVPSGGLGVAADLVVDDLAQLADLVLCQRP